MFDFSRNKSWIFLDGGSTERSISKLLRRHFTAWESIVNTHTNSYCIALKCRISKRSSWDQITSKTKQVFFFLLPYYMPRPGISGYRKKDWFCNNSKKIIFFLKNITIYIILLVVLSDIMYQLLNACKNFKLL